MSQAASLIGLVIAVIYIGGHPGLSGFVLPVIAIVVVGSFIAAWHFSPKCPKCGGSTLGYRHARADGQPDRRFKSNDYHCWSCGWIGSPGTRKLARERRLRLAISNLGDVTLLSKDMVISKVGDPSHTSNLDNGNELLQWSEGSFHASMQFSGQQCKGISLLMT